MEIHVFGEPAVGPAGVVSIFGFSQPLWVVSTVLHGSPKKNYQAITFMLKFVAWMYWMSISKEKNTYSCIPSGKQSHSDGWNIPMFNRNYIFNPGPFSCDCYVSLLDCNKQMLCGPCLPLHIQFSRTSTLFQLLLFRDLIWSSHQCMIVNAWHHICYFQYTGWSQLDITGYSILFVCQNQLSNEQNPGWLGYIGDYTTQGGL